MGWMYVRPTVLDGATKTTSGTSFARAGASIRLSIFSNHTYRQPSVSTGQQDTHAQAPNDDSCKVMPHAATDRLAG
jgi:hypothetical protein